MKFILVVFLFSVNPNSSDPQEVKAFSKQYSSLEECNYVGNNFRSLVKNIPENTKSVSTCVPVETYSS